MTDKIKLQAARIAKCLKAMAVVNDATQQHPNLTESKAHGEVRFAIAMDDKLIKVSMEWKTIEAKTEDEIAAWIESQMRPQGVH